MRGPFFQVGTWLSQNLLAVLIATPLAAQDSNASRATMAYLAKLVSDAESGVEGIEARRSVDVSMTLLSLNGVPILAYRKETGRRYGSFLDFTFDCAAPGVLRMTFMLEPLGSRPLPGTILAGHVSDVRIRSSDLGLDAVLRDGATILGPVERLEPSDEPYEMFRVAVEVQANGRIASALGPTGNLRVQLKEGEQFINLSGGANLSGYETDLHPLLKYCATTDPNYTPPPPSVEEIADGQPILIHPSVEQAQAALLRNYGMRIALFGAMLGVDDMKLAFEDFDLMDCVDTVEGPAFCEYSGRVVLDGETLAPAIAIANASLSLAGSRWASFVVDGSRWEWSGDYIFCDRSADSIYCEYWK